MIYRAIGVTSENAQSGLDIAFVELQEQGGKWTSEVLNAESYPYPADWSTRLQHLDKLSAVDYNLLHKEYGLYTGQQVNRFIEKNQLQFKVALIAAEGLSAIPLPGKNGMVQLGDGGAIAAETGLPVVTDFLNVDRALGGQEQGGGLLHQKLANATDGKEITKPVFIALMGILRWREEYNVFATESGAVRNSIGGALWMGQDA